MVARALDTHRMQTASEELQNEAMVVHKVGDMSLVPWPMPELGPDELLIEVQRVGICGSDVHYWKEGRIGHFVVTAPMVIGHESAGIVARVGANIMDVFQPGDRVAMEPGVPCEACAQCKSSKYNLCPVLTGFAAPKGRQGFFATPPVHGSMARYVAHPGKYCFKLPDNVSLEEGAMCEPLSVGVYACEQRAKVTPGSSVAVFGAGPIGTITAMVAHGLGAKKIILVEVNQSRLDFCKAHCCPVETINSTDLSSEEVAKKIKELNDNEPVDGAVDCTGAEPCIQAAIRATKTGGAVCIVGMGRPDITLPLLDASMREVDLCGVFRYRYTYRKCIQLLAEKKLDVSPLITHRFDFTNESILEAFETCHTGRDGAIKCMIAVGNAEAGKDRGEPRTKTARKE